MTSRERRVWLAAAILGTALMTLWMANREPFWLGPLWSALIAVATSVAWVVFAIGVPDAGGTPWRESAIGRRPEDWVSPVACLGAALGVLVIGATLGGYAYLSVTFLGSLACLAPAARHRPGLAAWLIVAAVYLPGLGTTGLWDPWETHYGEVAREILARNDWISLWWAQENWFWSKPALLFWMEALSMGMLGVDFMPDAHPAHPEWAVRLPIAVLALCALAMVDFALRRPFGSRAAALSVLVLGTMPQVFFIAHQAITDLPLVAAITMASCSLLLALTQSSSREAELIIIGRFRISLQHVVAFVVVLVVLPQVTYLLSRNLSWVEGYGLVAHPDRFLYGSAGNVGVPGNPSPRDQLPAVPGLLGQPFLQGILWLGGLGGLLATLRRERRARALWMVAFYFFCGIGLLAKGLLGVAIPGAAALFYLLASRRWSLLRDGELRVSWGVLVVAIVGFPWYVAMAVRHGASFVRRILIHDHINRLAAGVHGDTGTVEYFVTQLGYATFPWVGLVPLAALAGGRWLRRAPESDRAQAVIFLGMWLLSSFVLFSATVTKFHHYILPAVVPIAVLVGVALDACWGRSTRPDNEARRSELSTIAVGVSLVLGFAWLAFVGRDLSWVTSARPQGYERLIDLFVYKYERPWPEHLDYRPALTTFSLATSATLLFAALSRWRAWSLRAFTGIAVGFCMWSLHVYMAEASDHWTFRNLADRYYAERSGPEEPLIAWQMNWKGENFYTGNRVYVFAETDNVRMTKWLDENAGRRIFVALQHVRLARLQELVPKTQLEPLTTRRDNNKFILVTLEVGAENRLGSEDL